MSIKIERYKNNNKKNRGYGKTYGCIVHAKKTVDIRRLATHIQGHGSIYTYDTIVGVLAKMEQCIPELLSPASEALACWGGFLFGFCQRL